MNLNAPLRFIKKQAPTKGSQNCLLAVTINLGWIESCRERAKDLSHLTRAGGFTAEDRCTRDAAGVTTRETLHRETTGRRATCTQKAEESKYDLAFFQDRRGRREDGVHYRHRSKAGSDVIGAKGGFRRKIIHDSTTAMGAFYIWSFRKMHQYQIRDSETC